jgi:hypothetical protein
VSDQGTKKFFKRISAKLAVLLGGTVAFVNSAALVTPQHVSSLPSSNNVATTATGGRRLPEKLVLRKTSKGLKMIAQHSSHASHASHSSHSSHGSHSSHSSHASRAI